ncbi:hypothetical protein CYY_008396 [Polysphondylium violaceum]|uniref:SET domain-containing protein n=1 Tax=Polysphondylium violaceum TaxID=133409 RepID=A0A8J4UWZ1_9MYCE|nr:hypothetical protein CYY_008396 [Polysphondylium violaceum]
MNKFKIEQDNNRGRKVIATEECRKGQLLFQEESFVSIPLESFLQDNKYCYLCCAPNVSGTIVNTATVADQTTPAPQSTFIQCNYGCSMYFCGSDCANDMTHQLECSFVNKFIQSALDFNCDISMSLLGLRTIIKNKLDEEKYKQTVGNLSVQKDNFIKNNKAIIDRYYQLIDVIIDQLVKENTAENILSIFNREEYTNVICSIMINSFAGISNDFRRLPISNGFFYQAALLNHNCEPNSLFFIQKNVLQMVAVQDVKPGQQLLDCYTDLLTPTLERQKNLIKSKNFVCDCSRCTSPTENDRFFSSIECVFCSFTQGNNSNATDANNTSKYYVSPKVIYNWETQSFSTTWRCNNRSCSGQANSREIMSLVQQVDSFHELLNNKELLTVDSNTIDPYGQFLKQLSKFESGILNKLHPNHYCCLLYNLRLSKVYEYLTSTADSLEYLLWSVSHYKEVSRIVESVIRHPSSEAIDSFYHLGRISEKCLLSLIHQRNAFTDQEMIDRLNVEIKKYLELIATSYQKSSDLATICYGDSNTKSMLLKELSLKSNMNKLSL